MGGAFIPALCISGGIEGKAGVMADGVGGCTDNNRY